MTQQFDRAFVLDAMDYQETSSILRLLTENEGRVSLVAKGLRRGKATGGGTGIIQAFNLISVKYYLKDGQTLGTYAGAEIERAWSAPRSSLECYGLCTYWFDILRESGQARQSNADIFRLTGEFLEKQEVRPGLSVDVIRGITDLCRYLGFGFSWGLCSSCGDRGDISHFSIKLGPLCQGCGAAGKEGMALRDGEREMIRRLVSGAVSNSDDAEDTVALLGLLGLLNRFLVFHLEHSFKSFAFVQSMFGEG